MDKEPYAALAMLAACYREINARSTPSGTWDGASILVGLRAGLYLQHAYPTIGSALREEYAEWNGSLSGDDIAVLARVAEGLLRGMPPQMAMLAAG